MREWAPSRILIFLCSYLGLWGYPASFDVKATRIRSASLWGAQYCPCRDRDDPHPARRRLTRWSSKFLFLVWFGGTQEQSWLFLWKQGEPITFQGLKPWSPVSTSELTETSANHSTPDNAGVVVPPKKMIPCKQHFHSGELFLRLRLPDNIEEESKCRYPFSYHHVLVTKIFCLENPHSRTIISGGGLISVTKLKSMIKLNQVTPTSYL